MGYTWSTKDGFVGSESLVRLSWTKRSIHHLRCKYDVKGDGGRAEEVDLKGELEAKNAGVV